MKPTPDVRTGNSVADLKRAGFRNVRIEHFPGAHDVDPGPLRTALEWFVELAAPMPAAK